MKIKGKNANLVVNGIDCGKVDFAITNDSSVVSIGPFAMDRGFGDSYIAFLRKIEEDPTDNTAKLILCDFLEESQMFPLLDAWKQIIATNRTPNWYSNFNVGWGWFFQISDGNEPDHYAEWKYFNYISNPETQYAEIDDEMRHSFYKSDFIYAYHDYAQAIVKFDQAEQKKAEEAERLIKKQKEHIKEMETWSYSELRDYYDGN